MQGGRAGGEGARASLCGGRGGGTAVEVIMQGYTRWRGGKGKRKT